jgi:cobalt-zinc-cadmium efflux system outer membrane protein
VIAAIAAAPSLARADEPRAITLDAARAAVGAAPDHRVATANERAAELEVAAAGPWPTTSVVVTTSHKTARFGMTAAIPLPVFGTLGAARAVARAEYQVARAQVGSTDLGLRRDVTKAWLELARVEARAAISDDDAKREEQLATVTAEREKSGDASKAEVVQATAAAKRARAQATADETAIGAASADLARLLGWSPDIALHADGGFPSLDDAPAGTPDTARHPDARVAAARTDAEGARVEEARKARLPHLALDLETAIDDPTLPGNDFRGGFALEIPIFGRTTEAIDAAAARQAAARAEADAITIELDGQRVAAARRYQAARDNARAIATDVLPAQRQAADLARAAFTEGAAGGLIAVLAADRALAEVEAESIDAQAAAASARADLEWANGVAP